MRPVARMPAIPPNETAAVPPASLSPLRRLVLIILSSQDYRLVGRLHLVRVIVDFRQQRAQVGPRNFYKQLLVKSSPVGCQSVCGSSVNSSLAWPTPRRAKRPTDTRRERSASVRQSAKVEEISSGRSTDRHIEAIRLVSLTAGPTTVKSSRS